MVPVKKPVPTDNLDLIQEGRPCPKADHPRGSAVTHTTLEAACQPSETPTCWWEVTVVGAELSGAAGPLPSTTPTTHLGLLECL